MPPRDLPALEGVARGLGCLVEDTARHARAVGHREDAQCRRTVLRRASGQRRRLDAAGRRDAGLVEEPAQDQGAPRREVVAVVVEEGVDLVRRGRERAELLDPLLELRRRVHPVEALRRLLGLDVPRLLVPPVEAHVGDAVGRFRVPGDDVGRARHRRVDRDVREPRALEEVEGRGAFLRLHPRAVTELDERDERRQTGRDALELFERSGRLREPRVVLEEDPAQLSGQLERLDRCAERGERRVGRLSVVVGHRLVGLHVERELRWCALRPVSGHAGIRQVVVG